MFTQGTNFGKTIISKLKEYDLYIEDVRGTEKFAFELPKELTYVLAICPKAFVSYFPYWLKEEFAKRTPFPFKVTSIGWKVEADNYLDGCVLVYTVEGRVVMGEDEN